MVQRKRGKKGRDMDAKLSVTEERKHGQDWKEIKRKDRRGIEGR